ncbi:MAG TPA: hypothetical protein VMV86_01685, partial [Methanosarcinales archaeon]|nr:hypothetical protein [Methanosarcinales archaeon]
LYETFSEDYANFNNSFPEEIFYSISYLTGARVYFHPSINNTDEIIRNTNKLVRRFKASKSTYMDVLKQACANTKAENTQTLCVVIDHSKETADKAEQQLRRRAGGSTGFQGAVQLSKFDIGNTSDLNEVKGYYERGLSLGQPSGPRFIIKQENDIQLSENFLAEQTIKTQLLNTKGSITVPQAIPSELVNKFAESSVAVESALANGVSFSPIGFVPTFFATEVFAPLKDSSFFRFSRSTSAAAEKGLMGNAGVPLANFFSSTKNSVNSLLGLTKSGPIGSLGESIPKKIISNRKASAWKKLLRIYDLCLNKWPQELLSTDPITIVIYPDPVDAKKIRKARADGKKIDEYSEAVAGKDFLGTYRYFSVPEDNSETQYSDSGSNILSLDASIDHWLALTMSSLMGKGSGGEGKEVKKSFKTKDLIGITNLALAGPIALGSSPLLINKIGGIKNSTFNSIFSSANKKLGVFDVPSLSAEPTLSSFSITGISNISNMGRARDINILLSEKEMRESDLNSGRPISTAEEVEKTSLPTEITTLKTKANELLDSAVNFPSLAKAVGRKEDTNDYLTSGSLDMEYERPYINDAREDEFSYLHQRSVDAPNIDSEALVLDPSLEGILPIDDIKIFERLQAFNINASQEKRNDTLNVTIKVLGDQALTLTKVVDNTFMKLIVHTPRIVDGTAGTNFLLSGLYRPFGVIHEIRDGTFTTTLKLKAWAPPASNDESKGKVKGTKQLGWKDFLINFGNSGMTGVGGSIPVVATEDNVALSVNGLAKNSNSSSAALSISVPDSTRVVAASSNSINFNQISASSSSSQEAYSVLLNRAVQKLSPTSVENLATTHPNISPDFLPKAFVGAGVTA